MSNIAVAFNNQLNKFILELEQTYPNDKDFPYYKRLIQQLQKMNMTKPIEMFAFYIKDHIEEIQNRNSDFFLNNSEELIKNHTKDDNQNEAFRLVNNIKQYWKEMPENNKKVIWDYLNVLTKLSVSYVVKKQ